MNPEEAYILITGAGGAIGKSLSKHFHDEGARLLLVDKVAEGLNELNLMSAERKVLDLSVPDEVLALYDQFEKAKWIPNILINNAGVIHSELLTNFLKRPRGHHDFETWRSVIATNLHTAFYMGAVMADLWVHRRMSGLIINISSIAAQGNAGQSAYAASKAGLEALSKTWAKELGAFKIRSSCIALGFIDTASTERAISKMIQDSWKKKIPAGRFGQMEELLDAISFIMKNDYFNGKVLQLDGGLSL